MAARMKFICDTERCIDCNGCTYCFGCVGLSKKDFHILNEPYERQEYFAKVSELRRALRI